jgi:hypothetical protein
MSRKSIVLSVVVGLVATLGVTGTPVSTGNALEGDMGAPVGLAGFPAMNSTPPDGNSVTPWPLLRWTPGGEAVFYNVYLGVTPQLGPAELVDAYLCEPFYQVGEELVPGATYYWRVDGVLADGFTTRTGRIWTFTVTPYLVIDTFESYTDDGPDRLLRTWLDGETNRTGSRAGCAIARLGEPQTVHSGMQAMSVSYDDGARPFHSEVERGFVPPQDWTIFGGGALSLWFRGYPLPLAETSPGRFIVCAAGEDIWGYVDECRFLWKRISGDVTIVARIDSITQTHPWAKAGVMIRQSLAPASAHAFMLLTPDGRRAFQNRPLDGDGICYSAHSEPGAVTMPYWVKLERKGSQFTGYYSRDGVNWVRQPTTENHEWYLSPNPQMIAMPAAVYVGLALTSNIRNVVTIAEFSEVMITGDTGDAWQVADIGVPQPGNSPEDLYVVVEDSSGKAAMAVHPDPAAVTVPVWTEWRIPLDSFVGVDLHDVRKVSIGIGSPDAGVAGGSGKVYIDDIHLLDTELIGSEP